MKLFVSQVFFASLILLVVCIYKIIRAENVAICFHVNELNDRGCTLAVFEYAHYNEVLLNNTSAFVLPQLAQVTQGPMYPNFVKRFGKEKLYLYDSSVQFEMMKTAHTNKCDLLYVIKAGDLNGGPAFRKQFSCHENIPTLVHGVFGYERHGTVMAMISEHQAVLIAQEQSLGNRKELLSVEQLRNSWVPFMVVPPLPSEATATGSPDHPGTLRETLAIPQSAVVFCAHGGRGSFNTQYAREAVCKTALTHNNSVHFIFLGIAEWHNGCQQQEGKGPGQFPASVHFLPGTASNVAKDAYFESCDLMLHGRLEGETFGLAVAEMSVRNKPVLTFKPIPGDNFYDMYTGSHAHILGDQGFYYRDTESLLKLMRHFIAHGVDKSKSYNAYKDYQPGPVMRRFDQVFIQPALNRKRTGVFNLSNECVAMMKSDGGKKQGKKNILRPNSENK